ncbi:MAG: CDP-alcohol phosphatidyltransferase family protein [Rhodobiaceae bacterium]|nr:CDP-alcohol phosphatidyltransferase family protein [Rhodobiaceae bacterium]MCC0041743.1 CDP-alcohol phosphatidyltransferase family protein [Rhodobiaceae bacterium]
MTIPNILTILRLILVPVIIYGVIVGWHQLAFWLFITAGISDGVDGYIAKRFDQRSELGAYLDPLADKALLVSLFITLAILDHIPLWLTILVTSRDAFILAGIGVAALMGRPMEIDPLKVSKATTAFQIALICLVLARIAFDWDVALLVNSGIVLVAGLTLASASAYLMSWFRHFSVPMNEE